MVVPAAMGLLAWGMFADGAFYWPQARTIAIASFGLAALSSWKSVRHSVIPLGGVAIVGLGLAVSAWANGWPSQIGLPFLTLALAASFFLIAASSVRGGREQDLLEALCWVSALLAVGGIVGLGLHAAPWAFVATGIWRDSSGLGYANATALALVMGLPAALVLASRKPSPWLLLATFAIMTGLLTTLSRGGALAIAILFVVLALGGAGHLAKGALRPLVGGLIALVGLLPSFGPAPHPFPAAAGLLAGAAVAAVPVPGWRALRPRLRRGALVVAIACSVSGAAALVIASPTLRAGIAESRLHVAGDARVHTWAASLRAAAAHPVVGTGPGTFLVVEPNPDGTLSLTRFAHDEPIQVFFETGAVGLFCLLLATAILIGWAFRRRLAAVDPVLWASGIAACAAFIGQGLVDFVWHFPALVCMAFVWLAIATTETDPQRTGERP